MRNPEVEKKYGHEYKGVIHLPVNVCCHCGESDEPGQWAEDADGDRICFTCEEKLTTCICGAFREIGKELCDDCEKEVNADAAEEKRVRDYNELMSMNSQYEYLRGTN